MNKNLLALFFLFWAGVAFGQTRTITGKVTAEEDGSVLPGVSILLKGSNLGTSTNVNGEYSINAPADGVLVFSFVGFVSREVQVGSSSVIDVVLLSDIQALSEVVVTGVGVATERKKLAIAVESLNSDDLPKAPTGTLDQALVGKIAGAQIASTSGQPGQQASILLRGINTLGATQPMILVDGVQINAGSNDNGSARNTSSRLSDLDLSNVERVEVIQGAAAGTIYGAQGANGVIQIFTKKGKKGQTPTITLSHRMSIDNAIRGNLTLAKNHFFNTSDGYIIDGGGRRLNPDVNGSWGQPSVPAIDGTTVNNKPYMEQTYDHLDQLLHKNVQTHNTNLTITGGGNSSDYAFTLSKLKQGSIIFGKLDRYNVSSNLGAELFKNFTIRSITQLVYSDNGTGGITGSNNIYSGIGTALNSRQFWDLTFRNPDGDYVADPEGGNSVNPFYTQQYRRYTAKTTRIVQNFNLNYKINRFIELDYKFGIDNYRYDFNDFIRYQGNVKTSGDKLPPLTGRITNDRDSETFQNSLLSAFIKTNFEKDFGMSIPIQTSTHFAYDWRKRLYQNLTSIGSGFSPFPPYNLSTADEQSNEEENIEFVTYGYLINQRIDYGSLFGVSGGVRVDYASTFGAPNYKAFVFPRADAYFNLGDVIASDKIYEFKLRAAYGQAGTQPDAYDRFITLNTGNIGNSGYLSLKSTANNPELNVQVSKETEFGTDLGFTLNHGSWLSRLNINATYWMRKNTDVIRELDLAPSSGASGLLNNAISIDAKGFQLGLDLDVHRSENLDWTFGTRFGTSRSIISNISNGKEIAIGESGSGQFVLKEGEAVSTFFGRAPLHRIDQQDANGSYYLNQDNAANYTIVNGMVINKATKAVQFTTDNVKIGDPTPKFNMTFLSNATFFKKLMVDVQLDWVYGNDIYNQTKQWLFRDYMHSDFDKEITVEGQSGAYVAHYVSLYNTNTTNGFFVEKGSFLRLRNVGVSYDLASLIKASFLKSLNVNLSARNLLTFTKYSGIDPEAASHFNSPIYRGLDLYTFPNIRTFQFGISAGF